MGMFTILPVFSIESFLNPGIIEIFTVWENALWV